MVICTDKPVWIAVVSFLLLGVIEGAVLSHSTPCRKRSGHFAVPGSLCTSYYVCQNWEVLREENCPADQHFNPIKGWCDLAELYPCLEKPIDKECPKSNGRFLKKGTKCEKYFDCCDGKSRVKKCPKGTLFDDEYGKCDWEELVECDESSKNKECPKPNGKFVKPGTKCRTYFECRSGKAKEKKCDKHQLFNTKSGRCDREDKVDCKEKENKNCPKPFGNFLKPGTECKVYFDCYKGKATEKKCPKDQLFDTQEGKCEWEELVTCSDDESSSESSSSESNESSRESTPDNNLTSPRTSSEELISDSTTEGAKSPSPITASTADDAESPLPTVESTSQEASYSITDRTKLDRTESTLVSSHKIITPTPTLRESTTQQTASELSSSEINKITFHSTHGDLTSDSSSIRDLTSISTEGEILSRESTTESTIFESFTTVEDITSSIYFSSVEPRVSTTEENFSSYQTEHSSSYGSEETKVEEASTQSEHISITQSLNTDGLIEVTSEIVDDILSDSTDETITADTKNEIVQSSTFVYETTIDPVLVGFVCPETNGYYPHPRDKHKFIGCVHNIAYIMDCPAKLVYNDEQKRCLYDK